jgi:hypothetical protein
MVHVAPTPVLCLSLWWSTVLEHVVVPPGVRSSARSTRSMTQRSSVRFDAPQFLADGPQFFVEHCSVAPPDLSAT